MVLTSYNDENQIDIRLCFTNLIYDILYILCSGAGICLSVMLVSVIAHQQHIEIDKEYMIYNLWLLRQFELLSVSS